MRKKWLMSKKIGFVSSAVLLHNVEELLNIFVEDIVTKSIATGTAVEIGKPTINIASYYWSSLLYLDWVCFYVYFNYLSPLSSICIHFLWLFSYSLTTV